MREINKTIALKQGVMFKRLDRPRGDIEAIIVDDRGMDFYTNETGIFVLEILHAGKQHPQDIINKIDENTIPEVREKVVRSVKKFIDKLIQNKLAILQ